MPQKYFTDTLESRFIKCLLWDTPLPKCQVWKPGDEIIAGFTYITFDNYIVISKKDWSKNYGNEGPQKGTDSEYFKIVKEYVEGRDYPNITVRFKSNNSLYDSDTHYYLGNYLRFIRDRKNIDLMPFYNCFSGSTSDKIRIEEINGNNQIVSNTNKNDGKKLFIVPIKFNSKYTIYFNNTLPVKIIPVYYDNIFVENVCTSNGLPINGSVIANCSYSKPYVFNGLKYDNIAIGNNPSNKMYEEYLCLLVQVSSSDKSNLLVLEGDYSNNKSIIQNNSNKATAVYIGDGKDANNEKIKNFNILNYIKVIPSLTRNISDVSFAFSDRLIEYLLYSVIVPKDKVKNNIYRIQKYVTSNKSLEEFKQKFNGLYTKDIWSDELQKYIYDLVTKLNKNNLCFDINGYVDKDTEFILDRAKVVEDVFNV